MGEATNLVENFKVEKVIFNCGEFNDLEHELIEVLDKKKIPYYSCIKELNIDDNKLYFFNNVGYKGLYNGETANDIAKRQKHRYRQDILDNMGSDELIANLFRISQTEKN